jgi:chromosome segregation ATPase
LEGELKEREQLIEAMSADLEEREKARVRELTEVEGGKRVLEERLRELEEKVRELEGKEEGMREGMGRREKEWEEKCGGLRQ